jgi:hypothetical protein
MKRTRRKRVTVETERVLVFTRTTAIRSWCERCGAEGEMVGAEEASTLSGLSQRIVFRLVESQQLHYAETRNGALLICLSSLLQNLKQD